MYQINKVNQIEESSNEVRIHLDITPDQELLVGQGLGHVRIKFDVYEIIVTYNKEQHIYRAHFDCYHYSEDEWPFIGGERLENSQVKKALDYVKENVVVKKTSLPAPFSIGQEWFEVSLDYMKIFKLTVVEEGYTGTVGFLTEANHRIYLKGIQHPSISNGVIFQQPQETQLFRTYGEAKAFLDPHVNVEKENLLKDDVWIKELFAWYKKMGLYKDEFPDNKKLKAMSEIIEEKLGVQIPHERGVN